MQKQEDQEEQKEKYLEESINDLYRQVSTWGYSDVKAAVEATLAAGLEVDDLAAAIEEYQDETGEKDLSKIDVTALAYDDILQRARNRIDEVIGFDISNDIKGGTEFYTAGNYMATTYDYSTEAQEQLEEAISKASEEKKEELRNDKPTMYFLDDVGVKIKDKKEKPKEE